MYLTIELLIPLQIFLALWYLKGERFQLPYHSPEQLCLSSGCRHDAERYSLLQRKGYQLLSCVSLETCMEFVILYYEKPSKPSLHSL
jgi:hypothetical protein